MQCQYCTEFQEGKVRYRINGGEAKEKKIAMRECRVTGRIVELFDKSCGQFKPAKRFWCERHQSWIIMELCRVNKQRKMNGCVTCRQGKIVEKILKTQITSRFKRGN